MICVLATIELRPGTRDTFLQEFAQLKPKVDAENGCIEYGAAVDLPSGLGPQAPLRPDAVVLIEKWSSLDTLKAHLAAPHMGPYRERVKSLVIKTTLQVLTPC